MNWVDEQNYEILSFENKNYFFNINTQTDLAEAIKIEKSLKTL
jgi:molybdopterin-guanine dinucleotide biosynthesis protein A